MSYDICLRDPATMEVLELPVKHLMHGGTFQAEIDENTGLLTPAAISDAWLNVTETAEEVVKVWNQRFYAENSIKENC